MHMYCVLASVLSLALITLHKFLITSTSNFCKFAQPSRGETAQSKGLSQRSTLSRRSLMNSNSFSHFSQFQEGRPLSMEIRFSQINIRYLKILACSCLQAKKDQKS